MPMVAEEIFFDFSAEFLHFRRSHLKILPAEGSMKRLENDCFSLPLIRIGLKVRLKQVTNDNDQNPYSHSRCFYLMLKRCFVK